MKSVFNKIDPPISPIIYGEICMCFDYDFDIKFIDNIIGVQHNEAVRKSDTMFNTTIGDNNPGSWSYKTDRSCTFESETIIDEISNILTKYQDKFMEACHKYNPSDFFVRIWVGVREEGEYPVIEFGKKVINILSSMGIRVDIVLYNEY